MGEGGKERGMERSKEGKEETEEKERKKIKLITRQRANTKS